MFKAVVLVTVIFGLLMHMEVVDWPWWVIFIPMLAWVIVAIVAFAVLFCVELASRR